MQSRISTIIAKIEQYSLIFKREKEDKTSILISKLKAINPDSPEALQIAFSLVQETLNAKKISDPYKEFLKGIISHLKLEEKKRDEEKSKSFIALIDKTQSEQKSDDKLSVKEKLFSRIFHTENSMEQKMIDLEMIISEHDNFVGLLPERFNVNGAFTVMAHLLNANNSFLFGRYLIEYVKSRKIDGVSSLAFELDSLRTSSSAVTIKKMEMLNETLNALQEPTTSDDLIRVIADVYKLKLEYKTNTVVERQEETSVALTGILIPDLVKIVNSYHPLEGYSATFYRPFRQDIDFNAQVSTAASTSVKTTPSK